MNLHASCVGIDGRGLLILGASGSGKSSLALDLIALGAVLVSDDRTVLTREGCRLLAAPPPARGGLIEARGIGLLRLPHQAPVPVKAMIDLDAAPGARLPERMTEKFHGVTVDRIPLPFPLRASVVFLTVWHWPPLDPDAGSSP